MIVIGYLDVAGYQFPGFSQSPGAENMPTDQPLVMKFNPPAGWRLDLAPAKALKVEAVLARASNAETIDPTYKLVCDAAHEQGLGWGGYGYSRNDRIGAKAAVAVFLRGLETGRRWTRRPMLDVENFTDQHLWTPRQKADYMHEWLTECERLIDAPIIYGPAWWMDANLGAAISAEFDRYDFMLSHYIHGYAKAPKAVADWYPWASTTQGGDPGIAWGRAANGISSREGWQFTSTGEGPAYGFASSWIDCNVVTEEASARWAQVRPVDAPPPTVPEVPVPEVTYPVGYGRDEMTLSQIAAKYGPNCEPTFFARFLAWLPTTGGKIGIGSGVRSVQPVGPTFAPGTKTFHMIQTYVDGTKWYSAFDLVCRTSNGKAVATREQATGTHSSGAIPQSWVPLQGGAEANLRGVHINVGSPGSSGFEVWHLQPVEQDGYDSWAKAGRKRPDPNREFPGKNKPPVPPVEPPPVTAYADMPPMPTLTVYPQPNTMEGWAVLQFQAWMNRYHAQGNRYPQVVVDGYYGPKTGDAVKAFQASKQLAPDGICGPGTWNAVVAGPLKVVMPGDATPDYDWQVEIIQMSLNLFRFQRGEKLIPITAETAGKYTIETTAAILDFQAAKGLKVDGIVGSVTYRALFTGA